MMIVVVNLMKVLRSQALTASSYARLVMLSSLVKKGSIVRDPPTCNAESSMAHRVNPGHSGGRSPGSSP